MKILMSGATSLQVKPPEKRRSSVIKIDVPGAVVDALREAGHTVDWRAVVPGEDLSSYDALWLNLAGVNSVNGTPGAIGLLWAASQEQVPAVIFLDDWKTKLTYQQLRTFTLRETGSIYFDRHLLSGIRDLLPDAKPTHYTFESADTEWKRVVAELNLTETEADKIRPTPFYKQREDFSAAEWQALWPSILSGALALLHGRKRSAVGIPAYQWGSDDIVRPTLPAPIGAAGFMRIDPSFIATDIVNDTADRIDLRPDDRVKAWGLAGLADHTDWITEYLPDIEWPVHTVGHRSNRKVKTEQDVVEFYSSTSAILSPSYYHAGSGWWRSRFIYAAALELPIFAADGEAESLGSPYTFSAVDIERMPAISRDSLGRAQQAALWPRLATREEFAQQVMQLVHAAIS